MTSNKTLSVIKIFVSIKAFYHFSLYIVSSEPAPSSSHSNYPEVESSASGYDADSKTYLLGESHSSWSSRGRGAQGKPRSNTDPPSRIASLRSGAVGKTSSVTWDKTDVR